MRLTARLFGILFAFVLILFFSKISLAQTINYQQPSQQYLAPNTNPDVPNNLHNWTQNVTIEVLSAVICQLSGIDVINHSQSCLGIDTQTGKIGFVPNNGSVIGMMSGMIASLYNPPVHTSDYIAYMIRNFGIAKPTYAQVTGIGFTGLSPVENLWITFRNVVYLLFVFVLAVIGLAIMLRVRIDPRTVMTVQNQIPKIIIGLVLVTLSFAIAGFLIDLMWISVYLIINLIVTGSGDTNLTYNLVAGQVYQPAPAFANAIIGSPLGGIFNLAINAATSVGAVIYSIFNPPAIQIPGATNACSWGPFCLITNLVGGILLGLVAGIVDALIAVTVGILAFFIIIIAIVWALFRLWFQLLKAYVFILIDVIFAPFWILAGLLPGASIGFGAWVSDLLGNLAAFPAAIAMIMLARVFVDGFIKAGTNDFIPPLLGNPGTTDLLGSLIALGIILATPGIVDTTKKIFRAPSFKTGGGGGIGLAAGLVAIPFRRTAGALFGQNAYGVPRVGSIWIGNRVGRIGQFATGGGFGNRNQPLVRWRGFIPGRRGSPSQNTQQPRRKGQTGGGGQTPPATTGGTYTA